MTDSVHSISFSDLTPDDRDYLTGMASNPERGPVESARFREYVLAHGIMMREDPRRLDPEEVIGEFIDEFGEPTARLIIRSAGTC